MNSIILWLVLFSYLMGAVPYGYLLTKKYTGANILEVGSGNIGSTNVKRVAGPKIAAYVQFLDMFKGLLPVSLALMLSKLYPQIFPSHAVYLAGIFAIIGHNFSVFLKFEGGKGVNTTLGASVLTSFPEVILSVIIYFLVKKLFRFVSLGSISLALALPLTGVLLSEGYILIVYLLFCSSMILLRHIPNMIRLAEGRELS